jgi:hypothetical protein
MQLVLRSRRFRASFKMDLLLSANLVPLDKEREFSKKAYYKFEFAVYCALFGPRSSLLLSVEQWEYHKFH